MIAMISSSGRTRTYNPPVNRKRRTAVNPRPAVLIRMRSGSPDDSLLEPMRAGPEALAKSMPLDYLSWREYGVTSGNSNAPTLAPPPLTADTDTRKREGGSSRRSCS